MGPGREQPCPCPHYRPGALGLGTHAKAPSLGYRALGPAPIPRFGSSRGGAPTVEIKVGDGMGEEEGQESPHPLLPWGQGLTPLEGQRQEVETPGAGFFNWFYFNFYYIFSFSIKEPLPTLYLSLLACCPPSLQKAGRQVLGSSKLDRGYPILVLHKAKASISQVHTTPPNCPCPSLVPWKSQQTR